MDYSESGDIHARIYKYYCIHLIFSNSFAKNIFENYLKNNKNTYSCSPLERKCYYEYCDRWITFRGRPRQILIVLSLSTTTELSRRQIQFQFVKARDVENHQWGTALAATSVSLRPGGKNCLVTTLISEMRYSEGGEKMTSRSEIGNSELQEKFSAIFYFKIAMFSPLHLFIWPLVSSD